MLRTIPRFAFSVYFSFGGKSSFREYVYANLDYSASSAVSFLGKGNDDILDSIRQTICNTIGARDDFAST